MDAYYTRRAVLPPFTGYSRQRGSSIGSLAAGVGRVAFPFAKKFLLPAVKSIGKHLIANTLPELIEVVSKKKSPKQAINISCLQKEVSQTSSKVSHSKNNKETDWRTQRTTSH